MASSWVNYCAYLYRCIEILPQEIPLGLRALPERRGVVGQVNTLFPLYEQKKETAKEMSKRYVAVTTLTDLISVQGEDETPNTQQAQGSVNNLNVIDQSIKNIAHEHLPFYKPLQRHSDKNCLIAAIQEKNTGETLLCSEHLDIYQGIADPVREAEILEAIKERSKQDLEKLSNTFP